MQRQPGLLSSLSKVVALLLQILISRCQSSMAQHEVPDLMELICTFQDTLQVVLVPTSPHK